MRKGDTLTITHMRGPLIKAAPPFARDMFLVAPDTLRAVYVRATPQILKLDGPVEVGKTLTIIDVTYDPDRRDIRPRPPRTP